MWRVYFDGTSENIPHESDRDIDPKRTVKILAEKIMEEYQKDLALKNSNKERVVKS
jgi:hypothetical protein